MKRRHVLYLGFGLGALAVLSIVLIPSVLPGPSRSAARLGGASPTSSPVPTPASTPSGLPATGGAMAYDPENHGVILFGGSVVIPQPDGTNAVQTSADTWLWNGTSWTKLDVSGPPARSVEMIAYDSVRHELVLFGGSGPAGSGQALLFQDTWTWDGTAWHEQHPTHVPNPRMRAALAFDERRGVVVMFGGEGEGTTTYSATWIWDGADWTMLNPATVPPGRHFATMAYDADRGVTVLFGGSMAGARFNDTWTWDGENWTEQNGIAPAARGWSTLVYDAAHRQVVAYVYFALDNNPVREYTMTWDGSGWTDRSTAGDPSPRAQTQMAYDPEHQQVVLYGPETETWTWDGSNWALSKPATAG